MIIEFLSTKIFYVEQFWS